MGWSGGTFSRVHDWTTDDGNGVAILSSRMDAEDDNFATGINTCLTKDGQNTPTANLPMGTYRHTGVGAGVAATDYARMDQLVELSAHQYVTAGGTANVLTATLSPVITAYAAGQSIFFKVASTNEDGGVTLNVNGLGAKNIYTLAGTALPGGALLAGEIHHVIYDGTQFLLLTPTTKLWGGLYASAAGTQTISSSSSWQQVTLFNNVREPFASYVDVVLASDKITLKDKYTGGLWLMTAWIEWAGDDFTNTRGIRIDANTATAAQNMYEASPTTGTCCACSGILYLGGTTDVDVTVECWNDSGTTDDIVDCELMVCRISDCMV